MISGASGWCTALMRWEFWGLDIGFTHLYVAFVGFSGSERGRGLREAALPLVSSVHTGAGAGQ